MAGGRERWRRPPGLVQRCVRVGGVERTFRIAAPPDRQPAPLLVVLHGFGMSGVNMAVWTGLAVRGPDAGFATVFPDGWRQMWDDHGPGRSDGIDDAAFIVALVDRLVSEGVAREGGLVLAGLSNGGFFAERLARHGLVHASAIALVAATARESSRRMALRPARPTAVLCLLGTGDPLVPYAGGRAAGPLGWMARRRTRRLLVDPDDRGVVAAEVVATDWAATNGCPGVPTVVDVPSSAGDPPVQQLSWRAPGCPPVVLHRIVGGGHHWPGGPRFMPALVIGRPARHLDATGILLRFAQDAVSTVTPPVSR